MRRREFAPFFVAWLLITYFSVAAFTAQGRSLLSSAAFTVLGQAGTGLVVVMILLVVRAMRKLTPAARRKRIDV